MKRNTIAAGLSLVVGLPVGWIVAMLLTPTLWRLESILHLELAGHSGPSDWVFYVVWAVVLPVCFFFLRFVVLPKRNDPDRIDPNRPGKTAS